MRSRKSALATLVATLAVAVAGCGGSTPSDAASASSAQPVPNGGQRPQFDRGAFDQLRQCLEENGVTLPTPGEQGPPPSDGPAGPPALSEDAQEAFQACSQYLPSQPGGKGDFDSNG